MTKCISVAVIVPTLNASPGWAKFALMLKANVAAEQVLIVDSFSTDGTADLARAAGFKVRIVKREDFDHGGTRQLGVDLLPDAEILIYLTQDAILAGADAIVKLLEAFADPEIAAAYGRQLPRSGATPIEAHARYFNYPAVSQVKDKTNRARLGFKTIFISNSFAAYRRSSLMAVGGFPKGVIFGEDTITAAKLILKGWKIAYVAEAQVYHSHEYTWMQDFRRYFDIGVLHSRESWLLEEFGQTAGEGKRFVLSELKYLWPTHTALILSAVVRTGLKLAGYRLGRLHRQLSLRWKRRLSMHRSFWK